MESQDKGSMAAVADPVAADGSSSVPPRGPPTPAFTPDTLAFSSVTGIPLPAAFPSSYEPAAASTAATAAPDSHYARSIKRPRSPSLDYAIATDGNGDGNGTNGSNGDAPLEGLYAKKMARLDDDARFLEASATTTATPPHDDRHGDADVDMDLDTLEPSESNGQIGHGTGQPGQPEELAQTAKSEQEEQVDQVRQALSALHGDEVMMPTRPGSQAATEAVNEVTAALFAAAANEHQQHEQRRQDQQDQQDQQHLQQTGEETGREQMQSEVAAAAVAATALVEATTDQFANTADAAAAVAAAAAAAAAAVEATAAQTEAHSGPHSVEAAAGAIDHSEDCASNHLGGSGGNTDADTDVHRTRPAAYSSSSGGGVTADIHSIAAAAAAPAPAPTPTQTLTMGSTPGQGGLGPGSGPGPGQVSTPAPAQQHQMPELAPRSPSSAAKRHKCPYCDTEFTRHHNLKSHLLTHSQEKPYICQGCDMRFRRLHDLKRHSKLHTGEKPHICPRCDRKFARGDALARHSKGAGGCAGRRSSMAGGHGGHHGGGGFSGVDDSFEGVSGITDPDDSLMAGMEYDGSTSAAVAAAAAAAVAAADDDERRRLSLPMMKAPHAGRGGGLRSTSDAFAPHGRTYTAGTATAGGEPGDAGVGLSSMAMAGAGSAQSLFGHHGMAESPKAMSPAVGHDGGSAGANTDGVFERRFESAHLIRPGTSNGDTNASANIFSSEQGMWSYIQTLEEKLKMQDAKLKQQGERLALLESAKLGYETQISHLTEEITMLHEAAIDAGAAAGAGVVAEDAAARTPADAHANTPAAAATQDPSVDDAAASTPAAAVASAAIVSSAGVPTRTEPEVEQRLQQQLAQHLENAVEP